MYYQLSEFYKRDIYLQYAEENSIQYNAFEKGERIEIKITTPSIAMYLLKQSINIKDYYRKNC